MSAFGRIPAELCAFDQWVLWRLEERDGDLTKVPYRVREPFVRASSTDSESWASFELAIAVADQADGIGFVFSTNDPFCGQDFDDCLEGKRLHPEVAARVLALGSYTEISPSGNGIKTIVRGSKSGTTRCRTSATPWGGRFECYDAERFFTITGALLPGMPPTIAEAQDALDDCLAAYLPKSAAPSNSRVTSSAPVDLDDQDRRVRGTSLAARTQGWLGLRSCRSLGRDSPPGAI